MSAVAILLILGAALAHAGWNLFNKQAATADTMVFLWLVAAGSVTLWAPFAIATAPPPSLIQLFAMGASSLLHLGYFTLLQRGYRYGDLSLVYPLARGTGPMLSSAVAILLLGERPGPVEIAGIMLIGVGIFALGLPSGTAGRPPLPAVGFGLGTGLFIAAYTILDAESVKHLAVVPVLLLVVQSLGQVLVMTPTVLGRRTLIGEVWRAHRWRVIGTASLSPLSYIMVLTALKIAPVSSVAPMREVSVLVGVILGGRLLAEGQMVRRLTA
ncbi:MAG TPA: EamA family transporter, partial [Thermopolyspora sp.]